MDVTPDILSRLYWKLRYIRRVEEEIARIYPSDKIKSPVHLSIGQEAISVGVCDALEADDVVSGSYRGHAVYLAKDGDLKAMMAELYGKATGCASGKGGSMHLVDMGHNILGASAVVGTTISVSVGYALALKREGKGRVMVSFFGDGAIEEGCFYESVNFAALHRLPILFVCENNLYAIHTPQEKRWASPDLCARISTFGIPVEREPDMDVLKIRSTAGAMIDGIRNGEGGAAFLECRCYRWKEHVGPNEDYDAGYRSLEEAQPWLENDQVTRIGAMIVDEARSKFDNEIEQLIAEAVDFAEKSPAPSPEDLYTHVFAN